MTPCNRLPEPGSTRRSASALLPTAAALLLAACGGGGGGGATGGNGSGWTPGVFLDADTFRAQCVSPRSGTNPQTGQPWPDVAGTRTDENNFLRSYSNDTYLWYDEIVDRDPSQFATLEYFHLLKTEATTPSGADKDRFHFTIPTDEWIALSQSGAAAGYGAQWVVLSGRPPRKALIAYTDPDTPATGEGLMRGAEVLEVDGIDFVNDNTQAGVDTINAGLFPAEAGESHTFLIRDPDPNGATREITMVSEIVTSDPVRNVQPIPTPTGTVGYILFNDHNAPSEQQLIDAVAFLESENVVDLILDIRYNGGGFLSIASQLAYMIGDTNLTAGMTFERLAFNDKHPTTNPITGNPIEPLPFRSTSSGGQTLPSLNLPRVFVLTGAGTCSASESIMNGLRGVGVEVIQIGSTTCGKPYGFFPTDNCGTTYFTIQFRGENADGFGDYADGFTPGSAPAPGTDPVPGCLVADDFDTALGDPAEERFAAALGYREDEPCPAPSGVAIPGVGKTAPGQYPDEQIEVPRSPLREMRIMDRR